MTLLDDTKRSFIPSISFLPSVRLGGMIEPRKQTFHPNDDEPTESRGTEFCLCHNINFGYEERQLDICRLNKIKEKWGLGGREFDVEPPHVECE